ncbi:MAG: 16S rRNA (adenine(1518)-N(6)/adenine(1519)-N(6))-dimethyltransferase RsmA [Burkholderiales bacterium]
MAEFALHRARKRFGQNFLVEPAIVRRIVDCIDPQPDDRVIEIGPGLGALTAALLERVNRLDVVEIDRDLAARLEQGHARGNLAVHVGDALDYDFAAVGSDLRVVGNLPYNISSPLLFRLLEYTASIRDIHVMLQREVVDRMTARAGTSEYGRLTVMLGYRFAIERLFRVPSGAFRPQPKVESAFARLRPLAPLPWRASDEDIFRRVVAAAFSQRRKTLRNALSGIADEAQMRSVGVDPRSRGETLAVAQYVALSNAIAESG